jgi:hypothetical protein
MGFLINVDFFLEKIGKEFMNGEIEKLEKMIP